MEKSWASALGLGFFHLLVQVTHGEKAIKILEKSWASAMGLGFYHVEVKVTHGGKEWWKVEL